MKTMKILIADPSPVYRKMFTRAATEFCKGASIIGVFDGSEALALIRCGKYDIIVIDAEVSGLIDILEGIMLKSPNAFILVTARPSMANAAHFSEALSNGASECMAKPIYDSYNDNLVIIKQKISDIVEIFKHGKSISDEKEEPVVHGQENKFSPDLVLVAASTGGPIALESILPKLPVDFPAPIVVVQHIPPLFAETLASRLDDLSRLKVKVAEIGETIEPGKVYMAPGGIHTMLSNKSKIYFDTNISPNGVRPSADFLFQSVAESFMGKKVLVVVLTGMGNDGKDGLAVLRTHKSCKCIAQSERTCVVYGMPRAVIEAGFADKVLDLEMIASEMES